MTAALHTGRGVGNRATLTKIQQAKKDDPLYQDMDADECKDWWTPCVLRGKELKSFGHQQEGCSWCVYLNGETWEQGKTPWPTQHLLMLIHTIQLQSLHSRTGLEFFAMVTRSSIDEMIQLSWLGSEGAAIFLANTLGTNTWDLLRQFEQPCCSRKFSKPPKGGAGLK